MMAAAVITDIIQQQFRGGGARGNRRAWRRHRAQHWRQPVFCRRDPGDGAWRAADPDGRLLEAYVAPNLLAKCG